MLLFDKKILFLHLCLQKDCLIPSNKKYARSNIEL